MPSSSKIIPIQSIPFFIKRVTALGGDPRGLIAEFGLPEDVAERQAIPLRLADVPRVGNACARLVGDRYFGINTARTYERWSYDLLEVAARSAPTLRDAFERLSRYSKLINPDAVFDLSESPSKASFRYAIPGTRFCVGRHSNEFSVGVVFRIARECCGFDWAPLRVWFAHREETSRPVLQKFFGCDRIDFDAGENGFEIDPPTLESPVTTADPALLKVVDRHATIIAASVDDSRDLERLVRHAIERMLSREAPTLDRVASRLHLGGRTLQRKLIEHGTTFQRVLDETRRELAARLTRDGKSPTEIAERLRYSDRRSYARAARRWRASED